MRAGRWVRRPRCDHCEALQPATAVPACPDTPRPTPGKPWSQTPASMLVTHPLGEGAKGLTGSEGRLSSAEVGPSPGEVCPLQSRGAAITLCVRVQTPQGSEGAQSARRGGGDKFPPLLRKPYGTSRTSRVQPSKTPQVGARPTSERVRTAAPMQRAGRDPHLQVDEDGRHVHRAEHQPQGRHVVLQERSPHCTTAWSRRGGGGLTASQGQASTDGLSVGWPLSLAHSRLCASQRAWAFWGDPRVTLRGKPSVGPGGFWPGNQCEHWTPTPPRWAQLHREPLARGAGLQPQGNQGGLCCRCLRRLGKMRFPWDVRGIAQGYM